MWRGQPRLRTTIQKQQKWGLNTTQNKFIYNSSKDEKEERIVYPSNLYGKSDFKRGTHICTSFPSNCPKPTLSSKSDFSMVTHNSVFWISFPLSVKLGSTYFFQLSRVVFNIKWNKKVYQMLSTQHLLSVSIFWNLSPFGCSGLETIHLLCLSHHPFQKL